VRQRRAHAARTHALAKKKKKKEADEDDSEHAWSDDGSEGGVSDEDDSAAEDDFLETLEAMPVCFPYIQSFHTARLESLDCLLLLFASNSGLRREQGKRKESTRNEVRLNATKSAVWHFVVIYDKVVNSDLEFQ
jgi:hypothetical protein